jgi:lysophospholipase L1-like esterase
MRTFFIIILLGLGFFVSGQNQKVNISFFGSSVCNGTGAEENHGYAWQFFHSNVIDTSKYKYSNVSTGGDNTIKVENLDRLTNKLYPANPDMVFLGLSLGNEGIRSVNDEYGREQILEQFRSRLKQLADSLERKGLDVIIVNCYAHSYFSADHYRFTKRMNRELNTWEYPVVNVLGTIDDWRGRWVEGYYRDPWHPNAMGHEEMSYAIVPSLLDAIRAGKKPPVYDWRKNYTTIANPGGYEDPISIETDGTIHSFSISFRFKEADEGSIAGFISDDEHQILRIEEGALRYKNVGKRISQEEWTHVVLCHSFANQQTLLIVNGSLVGVVKEQLSPTEFNFGGTSQSMDIKDLAVHRSCLNTDEALDLYNRKFIPASLEFYAPLTTPEINNLAQSMAEAEINRSVKFVLQEVDW